MRQYGINRKIIYGEQDNIMPYLSGGSGTGGDPTTKEMVQMTKVIACETCRRHPKGNKKRPLIGLIFGGRGWIRTIEV